jgi:vitamin B12 transporter
MRAPALAELLRGATACFVVPRARLASASPGARSARRARLWPLGLALACGLAAGALVARDAAWAGPSDPEDSSLPDVAAGPVDAATRGETVAGIEVAPPVASAPFRREVPVDRIAGSVTVIGRSEIERRQLRTLPDALAEVPGLHVVQSGARGKATSIFTRGTESNHTLILLDGIEISDPSATGGVFDVGDFALDGLERVEVVRGPQSTTYGSDAIGGVINLVSRRGRGPLRVEGRVEAGAFGTFEQAIGVSGGSEAVDYSLSFGNVHTRGVTVIDDDLGGHERDGYDNRTLSGRVGTSIGDAARFSVIGRFVDLENELDLTGDDRDSRSSSRQLFLRAQGEIELLRGRVRPRFAVSYTDHDRKVSDRSAFDGSPRADTFDGRRLKLELLTDVAVAAGQVTTIGVETERETADQLFFGAVGDGSVRTSAAFVQHQLDLGGSVVGSLGGRLEHHDEFGSQLTYRAALAYISPDFGTRVHGTIGTGFKAPSIADELFSPFAGNEDLDPERTRGWEIGVDQPLFDGRLLVGTTYFQSRTRDLIEFAPSPIDPTRFQPRNIRRAKADGFESFIDIRLTDVRARIDHTYTMSEDRDTRADLLRRPSHQVRARLEIRPLDVLTITTSVGYVGKRKDVDFVTFGRKTLGGYTVARVTGDVAVGRGVTLFARIENVFDKDFRDPDGFESPGFAGFFGARVAF